MQIFCRFFIQSRCDGLDDKATDTANNGVDPRLLVEVFQLQHLTDAFTNADVNDAADDKSHNTFF